MNVEHGITILAVEDLGRSLAFYEAWLPCRRAVDTPVYVELTLTAGHSLGLYQRGGFAKNVGRTPEAIAQGGVAPAELYLRLADLERVLDALARAGASPLSPLSPRPWGDDAAYFADPDGFVVAVARPSARS